MERDHTLTLELVHFHWCESWGFKVSRLMGEVCVCLCMYVCVRKGGKGGACGLPWQLFLNQVWHFHMSENNGILYVFEHVSALHRGQMESDGRSPLRRKTETPKWEWGWPRGHRCGWPAVRLRRDSLSSNIPQLKTPSAHFLSLFTGLLMGHCREPNSDKPINSG